MAYSEASRYKKESSYYRSNDKAPNEKVYNPQNNPFPDFDIGKHLKGTLPKEDVQDLFSVRVNGVKDVVKQDIIEFFEGFEVADIHIPWEFGRKTEDGKPILKGYAFVRFKEERIAEDAVKALQDKDLKGEVVEVRRTVEKFSKKPYYNSYESNYKGNNYSAEKAYSSRRSYTDRPRESYREPIHRERTERYAEDYYTNQRPAPEYNRGPNFERPAYREGPPDSRYSVDPYKRKFEQREPSQYPSQPRGGGYGGRNEPRPYDNYAPPSEYRQYPPGSDGKRRRFNNYESPRTGGGGYDRERGRDYSSTYTPNAENNGQGSRYSNRNSQNQSYSSRTEKRY